MPVSSGQGEAGREDGEGCQCAWGVWAAVHCYGALIPCQDGLLGPGMPDRAASLRTCLSLSLKGQLQDASLFS